MSMLNPIICIPSFWQNCAYSLLYRYLLIILMAEMDEMYPSVIFLEYKSQLSWSQAEGSFLGKSFEDGVLLGKDHSARTLQSDSTSGEGLREKCIQRTPVIYCILPICTLEWDKPKDGGGAEKDAQYKMLTLKCPTKAMRRTCQFGQNEKVKGQSITKENFEHV